MTSEYGGGSSPGLGRVYLACRDGRVVKRTLSCCCSPS